MAKKLIALGFIIIAALIIWSGTSIYPGWLWFDHLGFSDVFWKMLLSKYGFSVVVWVFLILLVVINIYIVKRLNPGDGPKITFRGPDGTVQQIGLSGRTLNILFVVFILLLSVFVASKGSYQWDLLLRYLYQQPFGTTDPIFNKDIGFYVFSLPFYIFIRNGVLALVALTAVITAAWYLKDGALQIEGEVSQAEGVPSFPKITITSNPKRHLIFLAGVIVLLISWGFYLKIYGLLYSVQGPAFGASYTDVNVKILAHRLMIVFTVAFAIVLFISAFRFNKKLIWLSGGIWLSALVILGSVLPLVVQKFIVKPNELAKEQAYIAHNIENTRKAFNLNKIKEVNFNVNENLSAEELKKHDTTIQNIRIWDERPLLQTYRQIQTIRLYYDFKNVDVDRYFLNDQYRQVMLAARELDVNRLPAQAKTWVNRHLIYTHGYGLASNSVNEVTKEGLPRLLIKDLPPSYEPDLKVDRPEIYYGEKTDEYVLVKTKTEEFDYAKGDKNVYTNYQGRGGVPISSFLRRLMFAVDFLDPQILFTTYLSPDSRIMYNRRIDRRAGLVAPFLDYDRDPYLVVSEGRLYWIQDAYTTSDMYPYSSRSYGRFGRKAVNYIRNSVKITIDAYNGDVAYYIVDDKDPIAKTYSKIFPDLFKPLGEMPADLKKHIRYPKDLFKVQVEAYTKYHMEDAQVFYNQEDLWQTPDELYGDSRQEMEPYYIIIKLPKEKKEEFLLMLPFTPSSKDNMIGWLAARSDLPNYGNLIVYKLPKEKLVYGPMQIEARVDQQTEISRELSLWSQKGSRVIRGNLLAIPVADTFIYVEPVYLQAKQEKSEEAAPTAPKKPSLQDFRRKINPGLARNLSNAAALPELKRVIVAFGNRLVMEENLDKALSSLFGEEIITDDVSAPKPIFIPRDGGGSKLGLSALEHYNRAKDYLRQGKWAEYGQELDKLEGVLKELANAQKGEAVE